MKIVETWPPNIDEIRAMLDISGVQPVFTYGDTMYNPYKHHIDKSLIAHERVHVAQQAAIGGPDVWWKRYLQEPQFRASQEIAAYRAHLRALLKVTNDRHAVAHILDDWAENLAGEMYGGCVTHEEALRRIRLGIAR